MVPTEHHRSRIWRLRDARTVVQDLEDELDEDAQLKCQDMRAKLERAGSNIRSSGFNRYLEDAMGSAAGLAIGTGLDSLASRAERVMIPENYPDSEDALDELTVETDDRGRGTLGADWADQRVTLIITDAEDLED